jgi:hypothetical protein
MGAEENPYESPKEAGYDNPLVAVARAWRKDRLMLVGCALSITVVLFTLMTIVILILSFFGVIP